MNLFFSILLLLTQISVIALTTGTKIFPILMVGATLLVFFLGGRLTIEESVRRRFLLFSGLFFIGLWFVDPLDEKGIFGVFEFPLTYAIAQWIIALQLFHLFLKREKYSPHYEVLAGIVVFQCAGNVLVNEAVDLAYFYHSWFFTLIVVLKLTFPEKISLGWKKSQFTSVFWIVMLLLGIGWAASGGLKTFIPWAEKVYYSFVPQNTSMAGFTGQVELGDVDLSTEDEERLVLRVMTQHSPGYLRGNVLVEFEGKRWLEDSKWTKTAPLEGDAFEQYWSFDSPVTESREISLEVVSNPGTFLFTTLSSFAIAGTWAELKMSRSQILRGETGNRYKIYQSKAAVIPPVLSETDRLDFLQIPPQLQDCLQQLIEKKSISEARPEERVKLIEAFFRKGFNYSRKVEVPRGKNPMLWFLETKKAGHCEFFASAAALLLRSSGIPARLVTGFVVNEKNPFGEYFMVRNGDAHAWVEAWLPNRGWQIVEVTPDDGIPAFKGGNYFSHGLDWFLSRIQHFFLELRQRGIVVLIEYMMMVLPFLLVCLFCSFILYLWYRRGKKMYEQTAASLVLSAQTQELIELRKIMDEKLLRQKMVRTSVESLHSFATKLDEKQYVKEAKWYRDYALLLYCSQRSEEQFRQLRFDLDNLDSKDNNA